MSIFCVRQTNPIQNGNSNTYLYNGSLSPSRYQSTMNTTSPFSNGSMSHGNIACLPKTPRTDVIGTAMRKKNHWNYLNWQHLHKTHTPMIIWYKLIFKNGPGTNSYINKWMLNK